MKIVKPGDKKKMELLKDRMNLGLKGEATFNKNTKEKRLEFRFNTRMFLKLVNWVRVWKKKSLWVALIW